MRNLDDYPNVKHNGKIYFQLGLLASLIAVYFIIELETPVTETKPFDRKKVIEISEKPFNGVFIIEKAPQKEIAKVETKPISQKPIVNQFKPIDNSSPEPENVETTSPDDTPVENLTPTETPTTSTPADIPVPKKSSYEGYELDELPTFLACSGLKGDAQKACFNEQMKKYLQKNLNYPARARENETQGSVLVEFIINSNGKVSNVKPANANKFNDKDLENEALRVVSKLPNLKPGIFKGEPVNVRYRIPITFKLNK
jgi:protein TonB